MVGLATAVIGACIVALGASILITRAARRSPLVNIVFGAVAVIIGFSLLILVFVVLQRMALAG